MNKKILTELIDSTFPPGIEVAIGYGSGVFEQKGYDNNNNVNKKQLSENDINHFMKNIDKNNTSYFGLVKLRQINLDTLFMYEPVEITLLQYACMKGRDSIVMNLLRANANLLIPCKSFSTERSDKPTCSIIFKTKSL